MVPESCTNKFELKGSKKMAPRRKKWTEAEERTLIDKYGEMVLDGTLMKMKTREKKFRPIAHHVNSTHHVRDPVTYPWQWTWKDVSTKVQNMRHQYSLVKQKIKKPESELDNHNGCDTHPVVGDFTTEEFDWMEGLTHWSNFLRYKEVFGDVALVFNGSESMVIANESNDNGDVGYGGIVEFEQMGHSGDGDVLGLGFEYGGNEGEDNYHNNGMNNHNNNISNNETIREDGDDSFVHREAEPNGSNSRKKRKMLKGLQKKAYGFLANQLGDLKEMEARFAQHELGREQERQKREHLRVQYEQERQRKWEAREKERDEREKAREKLRKERILELEVIEKKSEEKEKRRKEEESIYKREWEERMNLKRLEWKNRIDEMLSQHRVEMGHVQTRIVHEQQNLTNHLLGSISQWTGHQTALSDHTGATTHYFSQMMQNLHNVNGMDHGDDTRVDEDTQDDQFIVDG